MGQSNLDAADKNENRLLGDMSKEERTLVRDLMKVGVTTCPMHAGLPEIARMLLDKDLEALVVLDSEGHAQGIVSQDELVAAFAHKEDWRALTAEDVMRADVPQVPADIPLTAAVQLMRDQRARVVFITHHAGGIIYPAAALSFNHLLRLIAANEDGELNDLGTRAVRQTPLDAFLERREAARRAVRRSKEE